MSSALPESSEFLNEESCPLVVDSEEDCLDHDEDSMPKILHKQKHYGRSFYGFQPNLFRLNFWTFTTCVLVICLLTTIGRGQSQYNYEKGYDTEFFPAREAISIKKVSFTGGLYYDSNGTLHISSNPEEPTYIGPPSDALDDAWEALIHDRYVAITPDQAKEIGDNLWLNQENGIYRAGMDVLHTLHCLNLLRMTQDLDYYVEKGILQTGRNARMHVDHCINHLRQIVQCHGDMTPLPIIWADIKGHSDGGRPIPNFDQVHTCRDFTALREWSTWQDRTVQKNSNN